MKLEGSYRIEVERADLGRSRIVPAPMKAEPGTIIASIDRFALTANNVTYAVHGADLGYWRAWPATEDGYGVVPVWGFATIAQGEAEGIRPGMRFWGFWPSANYARLHPGPAGPQGFSDTSGARAGLAPVYTRFLPAPIPARPEEEDLLAVFQPLFGTGFLIERALGGRETIPTIVMTSASSKTALAAAWCLKRRGGHELVGLTSERHLAFVAGTGCFDRVLPYAAIEELPADRGAALVDLAGDPALVDRIHRRMAGLAESWIVGDTHRTGTGAGTGQAGALPGPARQLFFAPAVWQALAEKTGAPALEAALADAREAFLLASRAWFSIRRLEGPEGWRDAFRALLSGAADPAVGFVVIP